MGGGKHSMTRLGDLLDVNLPDPVPAGTKLTFDGASWSVDPLAPYASLVGGSVIAPAAGVNGLQITLGTGRGATAHGLRILDAADGTDAGFGLGIDWYGSGNGLDLKSWGSTGITLAGHQYASPTGGVSFARLDNTGTGCLLILANTENPTNNPNSNAFASDYLRLFGYNSLSSVADAVTNGTATVTSATAGFQTSDVGKPVSGTNIPASSFIGVVNSATSIGLSSSATANVPVNATGSGSGGTVSFPKVVGVTNLATLTSTLQFVNKMTGASSLAANPWTFTNATANSVPALVVIQSASNTSTAFRVNNQGSGAALGLQLNGTNIFQVLNDGQIKYAAAGLETTGAGSAALGANCPAVTATAPYKWWKVTTSDGSQGYVPVWK